MRFLPTSAMLLLILLPAFVSQAETGSRQTGSRQTVTFDSDRWTFDAAEHRVTEHLGRPSLYLKGGAAWIADAELTDGVIEFDVAFTGERGFMGGIWRMRDRHDYEEFYVRPHQSGKPDANQYTPVFHGVPGWQLYHGKGYGAPLSYPTNAWIHIKIVFSGGRGEVYVDSEEPVVAIQEMKHEVGPGKVGLSASNFAPAHFSRFSFQKLDRPALAIPPPPTGVAPMGTVRAWSVSNAFAEAGLDGKTLLGEGDKAGLTWQTLLAERTGITNLARAAVLSPETNTVFARVVVHAESEGTRKVRFGYSDRVKVYLNDRLIYGGDNGYKSRDYRYLGTIGLFDELYLPLRQGENELLFAVSESFGGWGILGFFDDSSGLRLEP